MRQGVVQLAFLTAPVNPNHLAALALDTAIWYECYSGGFYNL